MAGAESQGIRIDARKRLHSSLLRFWCENQPMNSLNTHPSRLRICALLLSLLIWPTFAQEANVLGLPAVPQPKPGAVTNLAPVSAAASAAASAPKPAPGTYPNRDVLAGEMGLQHSALGGLGRLIITTRATFATAGAQSTAIDAARSVQRELAKSCLKQCQPQKMSAPKILTSGQMEFELAFRPLYQHLNQAQFVAALQSKPFNLTPAQMMAPAQAPAQVSVSVATQSSPTAATETK